MLAQRQVEIGFIVVNYNSAKATAQLLADLSQQDKSNCTVTVVVADNGPAASGLAFVRDAYKNEPGVRFESMPTNLGYFGAAHRTLNTVWKERLPDWTIVSNADIRLTQPGFFSQILHHSAQAGAVLAPRIVSGRTGLDQNPFQRWRPSAFRINLNRIIPRSPTLFWLMEAQSAAKRAIRSRLRSRHPQPGTPSSTIYAPHGAFIIFNGEYFRRGGNLGVGAFLFAEEIFVAETCRRLSLSVVYSPTLEVRHDEHVSTKAGPLIRRFQAAAADYCAREFFSVT